MSIIETTKEGLNHIVKTVKNNSCKSKKKIKPNEKIKDYKLGGIFKNENTFKNLIDTWEY